MPESPDFDLPTPAGSDANDFAAHMSTLANATDLKMAGRLQGILADRPAAGIYGRFYIVVGDGTASNNGRILFDNGTIWDELVRARVVRFNGQCGSGGVATFAHTLGAGLIPKIASIQGWFRGSSGELLPMELDFLDGNGGRFVGGVVNRLFFVSITFVPDSVPW